MANLLVLGAGGISFAVTFRLLAPEIFGRRVNAGGSGGPGGPGSSSSGGPGLVQTFNESVDIALLVSVGTGVIVAAMVAWLVAKWISDPIDDIRTTTRAIAEGHYDERVSGGHVEELEALAEDVNQLATSLAQTEQRRATLISDVTHELRTPLASIDGFAEGAVDGVFSTQEMHEAVTDETARMVRLVEDLSVLSKTSEGALHLEIARMRLRELAEDTVERLRPRFTDMSASIEVVVDADPEISGDRARLDQVLTNVLMNALGHIDDGGSVRVVVARNIDGGSVTVTDDGDGIRSEDLDRVFDRFFRGRDAHGRPGTGLGLSVARGIARAHGGSLVAASEGPRLGSTFTLSLPLAPAE